MNNATFGDRLKALRVEKNLLQSEFGELIGERMGTKRLSPSSVGSYERNEREPSFAILNAFADFFGVSLDYLLCRSEERLSVEEFILQDVMEFSDALRKLNLTHNGRLITEAEKSRIGDVAFALLFTQPGDS